MNDVCNLFVRYLRYASPSEGGSAKGIPLGGDDFQKILSLCKYSCVFRLCNPLQRGTIRQCFKPTY